MVEMPREKLRGLERLIVPFHERMNQTVRGQQVIAAWQRSVPGPFVRWITSFRWEAHHLERVTGTPAPRGTLIVSNHRSFFDMFVTLSLLFIEHGMYRNLFFPVRSNFFYTNPFGPFVDGFFSGFAMWPPVFRDDRRRELNPIGVQQILEVLAQPGSCIGMHPEGTRNRGDDPYEFLPPKPGVGQMVHETHPETLVVPVFMTGLSNDITLEIRRRVLPGLRATAPPIRWVFGEPMPAGEIARLGDELAVADFLLNDRIRALAEESRAISQAGKAAHA